MTKGLLLGLIAIGLIPSHCGKIAWAGKSRSVVCTTKSRPYIRIPRGKSTALSFSEKPTKVLPGASGQFNFNYVDNDLVISALKYKAKTNVFVYLKNKTCDFNLITVPYYKGDERVYIKGYKEDYIEVEFDE